MYTATHASQVPLAAVSMPAYQALQQRFLRLYRLEHLQSIGYWDQAANMPPGGASARADALAELATLTHGLRTDPALAALLDEAAAEPLADADRANLREMRREWRAANALPPALVQRGLLAASRCEHAWRTQRPANDWPGFAANLREVVAVARAQARLLAADSGLAPYDALLDRHEPGMTGVRLDALFADLRGWLPGLVARVQDRQRGEPVLLPQGPFDTAAQRRLCERLMAMLDFDLRHGRLDVSAHPFCGGVPEDVRLTNRYAPDDLFASLLGVVHECGHGRYEQGLPRALLGQPVALARSMGVHESQSLAFEMQLARHPGFVALLSPLLSEAFGHQPAFAPDNLQRLVTRVQPGPIRVDADELTYAPHVMLRFRIERALIGGDIEVDDIPAQWDAGMAELLGLDTRGNFRDGPMQDMHWPEGMFGYFPSYTLGAMYAAQWFAAMRRSIPALDQQIAAGQFKPLFAWLEAHIWRQGSRWSTDDLALRASGEVLNPAHYQAHLQARYLA